MRTEFAALLVAVVLGTGCKPDPNAPPIFHSTGEYQDALAQVQALTEKPFEALHEHQPISDKEKADLKVAGHLIDGLIAFKGDAYAPYILRGLTKRALGDLEGAKTAYQQGITLAPAKPTPEDVGAIGRIYDEMGTLYFELNDFAKAEQYADTAASMLPDEPSILTDTAGVKVQLNKTDEAKKLLDTAIKKEPAYQRALDLRKLLDMAAKKR